MNRKRHRSIRSAPHKTTQPQDWRTYQTSLKRSSQYKRVFRSSLKYVSYALLAIGGIYAVLGGVMGVACHYRPDGDKIAVGTGDPGKKDHLKSMSKGQVKHLLAEHPFTNLIQKTFGLTHEGRNLKVETSLDIPLQSFLLSRLYTATSRHIAIIAMTPQTGRVKAMVSFDKNDAENNLCTENNFPAASVFKIVTAAAAIEKHNFKPNTVMRYNGKKYTLYKSQLKEKRNKWTRKITLKDSFAQSVNPVFGKLGALYLHKSDLLSYANAFGFNHDIDFEIPLPPSSMTISDDPYQWAEIASGFNRETRISPLHGALMASAVINDGRLIEPTIVDRIKDDNGSTLYQGKPTVVRQAINPGGAEAIHRLMTETIKSGTGRKVFRGYRRDKVLSRLDIGGKTGSIDNDSHDVRYDWFVGYAEEKNGTEKIVLSVVVGHEKYIGTRAAAYAKMAIKHYFKDYFAGIAEKHAKDKGKAKG